MTQAHWTRYYTNPSLQRSSQTLAILDDDAYIFGGELHPREPVDSSIHCVSVVNDKSSTNVPHTTVNPGFTPQPRVGAASTSLNGKIYVFSGRGGKAMAPLEEAGAFWGFDPHDKTWSQVKPKDSQLPYPAGRSYHSLTSNGKDTIFLHAGCPEKGRLRDLWSFNIFSLQWRELASAPAPERGGTSIAYTNGQIFRMNGFDGKTEQGGALDVFNEATNEWHTVIYKADGIEGPSPRSVSCLLALSISGRQSLVTMFGERDPSNLGHQGAGKMLRDVWIFDVGTQKWKELDIDDENWPAARGWFDADVIPNSSNPTIVVHGGLAESNDRLDDVWLLSF